MNYNDERINYIRDIRSFLKLHPKNEFLFKRFHKINNDKSNI